MNSYGILTLLLFCISQLIKTFSSQYEVSVYSDIETDHDRDNVIIDDEEDQYISKFPTPVKNYLHKIKGKMLPQDEDHLYHCSIVSYYSKGVGLGIYAGRTFRAGDIIDKSPGIPVDSKTILGKKKDVQNVLSYYVEEFNSSHALASLGYAMLYNHAPIYFMEPMITKVFPPKESFKPLFSFSGLEGQTEDVHYIASRAIHPGEQIFGYYGHEWFTNRKQEEISPLTLGNDYISVGKNFNATEMIRLPGCASSMTIFKNEKLFASRFIHAGEMIEVTRALLLKESSVRESPLLQRFLWYRNKDVEVIVKSTLGSQDENNERHVLLPLGKGSLYQAPSRGEAPNVHYSWFDVDTLKDDYEPLSSKNQCEDRMFISFRAIRNIQAGEILTIDVEFDGDTRHKLVNVKFSKYCLFDKLIPLK